MEQMSINQVATRLIGRPIWPSRGAQTLPTAYRVSQFSHVLEPNVDYSTLASDLRRLQHCQELVRRQREQRGRGTHPPQGSPEALSVGRHRQGFWCRNISESENLCFTCFYTLLTGDPT